MTQGALKLDRRIREMAGTKVTTAQTFETGATRSSSEDRYDPEGYMSPLVEERFSNYMLKHQYQADGTKRDSDNWQKGMPRETYMKGMKRHVLHLWLRHRGWTTDDPNAGATIEEDLCAIIFNAQGYLHDILAQRQLQPVRKVECLSDYEQPFEAQDYTEALKVEAEDS
jgi:hypothetical protein